MNTTKQNSLFGCLSIIALSLLSLKNVMANDLEVQGARPRLISELNVTATSALDLNYEGMFDPRIGFGVASEYLYKTYAKICIDLDYSGKYLFNSDKFTPYVSRKNDEVTYSKTEMRFPITLNGRSWIKFDLNHLFFGLGYNIGFQYVTMTINEFQKSSANDTVWMEHFDNNAFRLKFAHFYSIGYGIKYGSIMLFKEMRKNDDGLLGLTLTYKVFDTKKKRKKGGL